MGPTTNIIWQLRLLTGTCLIIAVAAGVLFYPDNLREAEPIQVPLDPIVQDSSYIQLSGDLLFYPFSACIPLSNSSILFRTKVTSNRSRIVNISLPYTKSGVSFGLPRRTNQEISPPEQNTGTVLESVINVTLGPNRSDPIWRLRLLAAFSLVVHATIGVLFFPRDLQGVDHAITYRSVMLITSFGAPIVVAVITLLVSFWLEPNRWSDWITGLSVANVSMLGGRLVVYWTLQRQT